MRWGLDLLLALIGIVLGFVTVNGWVTGWEATVVSLLIGVVVALILGQYAGGKYFMNGFVTGIVASLLSSLIVFMQFDSYFVQMAQTPKFKEAMDKMAQAGKSMSMDEMKAMSRNWMLIGAPIGALLGGAVQGLLTLAAGKVFGKKPVAPAVAEPETISDDLNNPSA
ncbi:MAG TPA: hypothetical protein VGL38_01255 [bacterium]|jgi:hypothetical protein